MFEGDEVMVLRALENVKKDEIDRE